MVRALCQEQVNFRRFSRSRGKKETKGCHVDDDSTSHPQLFIENQHSVMDSMKEKFAKLLLGEDMSGRGKGVSSALALSNSITHLAASVFGEQKRLEPMTVDQKVRWRKEIDWLLSVTDHIVEFVPSQQKTNGVEMEIMTTKQRSDLLINIPALRKLDAMLIECLDNFKDLTEFYYVSKDENSDTNEVDDKWWLPTCQVPSEGLSESTRKWLQFQKDSVNQVHKAAMAINAQVLSEMEIPDNYVESLPKNGRSSLGDSIYKSITDDHFVPDKFLSTIDLSSDHKILDLKNRIEASIVIWTRKMNNNKDNGKLAWSSVISLEKREIFEERAETLLLILKHRYPGVPQSALDISKIQYNRDVGHAILESYSRIIESLAYTILSRIEDVLLADHNVRNPSVLTVGSGKFSSFRDEMQRIDSSKTPKSKKFLDFMGWSNDPNSEEKKDFVGEESPRDAEWKLTSIVTKKMVGSYLETLGALRSPTSRH